MTLENLDAQANLDAELSPSKIKANVILKDLNIDGFTTEPIPANLKWDQSGKVLVEIGTTSLKKDDVVQTKLKQGSLTLQLDPENKPVSCHWKSTHTDVHLPQAKLHLEDVQIEKYLDDQQLSVSLTTDYAELDDIALGKSNIAAEISEANSAYKAKFNSAASKFHSRQAAMIPPSNKYFKLPLHSNNPKQRNCPNQKKSSTP